MKKMKRIVSMILACALVLPMAVIHADATSENTLGKDDLTYMDVRDDNALSLHGLYMDKESDVFPRMDLDATTELNKNAQTHARESAGGRIRFSTNSSYVAIKAEFPDYVIYADEADADMGKGKYGFDVYVDTEEGSTYITTIAPETTEVPTENQAWSYEDIYDFGTAEERNITIYFPTLQVVSEVSVGVQETATVGAHKIPYDTAAPIVYYGSSITQGASATRPGLTYVNTIGRSLNRDYINLGMFGGCKAEKEFSDYIAGLDMSIFIYDHDHNYKTAADLAKRHESFYKEVRAAHPNIPIVFISRPSKTNEWEAMREVIKKTYHNAIANGDQNVYFIDGQSFFNGDVAYIADKVHPTDEGQAAMADTIGNVLKGIIDGNNSDDSYWYTDDFSYTAAEFANSGWTGKSQLNIDEQRGVLQVGKSANNTYTYLGGNTNVSNTWNDFTFEADVTLTSTKVGTTGTASAFLLFGGDEDNNESAYQFMLRTDNQVRLLDRKGTEKDAFGDTQNKNVTTSADDTYNMKVVTSGKTITCYLDDAKVFEVTSKLDETNPYAGRIGIRAQTNRVEVDNVRVYANRDEVLYEEGFDYVDGTSVANKGWTNATRNSIKDGKLQAGLGTKKATTVYTYLTETPIDETVTNYTVEADVKMTETYTNTGSGTPTVGLVVGASDAAEETKDGYQLLISGFETENGGEVILKDFFGTKENDMFSQIEKDGYTFKIGDTYNLKIVVNNKTIKCYVDDQLAIKYTCVTDEANPFAGRIGFRAAVNVVEVDNVLIRSASQFDDSYYNVSYYRNGLETVTHPYKEGKVFAGWYEDAEYRTPYSKARTTGYAYAKFVDENVLSMKAQITNGTDATWEETNLRLVTTVDSLNYRKIGFYASVADGETKYYDCGKVMYSTVKGFVDGEESAYQPTVFSNDSYRFATCYFSEQPQSTFDLDITVTPAWVTLDGTTVSGVQRTFKISDGFSN